MDSLGDQVGDRQQVERVVKDNDLGRLNPGRSGGWDRPGLALGLLYVGRVIARDAQDVVVAEVIDGVDDPGRRRRLDRVDPQPVPSDDRAQDLRRHRSKVREFQRGRTYADSSTESRRRGRDSLYVALRTREERGDLNSDRNAVVLLSGGLDSTTTLAIAKEARFKIHALTFSYGQRHAVEVEAAGRIARAFEVASHVVIPIDLRVFGGSALTSDLAVPKDR